MTSKQISLRSKLTRTTLLVGVFLSLAASIMFALTIRTITRDALTGTYLSLRSEVEQQLTQSIAFIDNTARNLIQSSNVYTYLASDFVPDKLDALSVFTLKSDLEKDISRQLNFNPAFENGLLETIRLHLDENHVVVRSRSSATFASTIQERSEQYHKVVNSGVFGRSFFGLEEADANLTFAYNLSSPSAVEKHTVLFLETSKDVFLNHYQSLMDNFPSTKFVLRTKQGQVLFSNFDQQTNKDYTTGVETSRISIDRERYRIETHSLANGAYLSTLLVSEKELGGNVTSWLLNFLFYFLALILLLLLGSYLFFARFNVFTTDFIQHIKQVGEGDFSETFPAYGDEDLDQIGRAFNVMAARIQNLIEGVYKKQLLIQQMDIRLLQSQMNPHFLFNVLFSISTRAKTIGDQTIYEMTTGLSQLLRTSLTSKTDNTIMLKQELDYVIAYLKIQQIRFGQRLHYELNVQSQALLSLSCPRLSLQPLVENAVLHGIEPSNKEGIITIGAALEDEHTLLLSVEDTGVGFSLDDPATNESNGNRVALQNLRERIRLLYGSPYGLQIISSPGQGCKAIIRIPALSLE